MSKVLQVELEAEVEKAEHFLENQNQKFGHFSKEFAKQHGLHLLGTTTTWFLFDITFLIQNLFQNDIFIAIGWIPPAKEMNAIQQLY